MINERQSDFSLNGKHIVVIGASSGIGAETAIRCAQAGAKLSISARRESLLQNIATKIDSMEVGYEVLDVRKEDEFKNVFDSFVNDRGPIDGMIYASGFNIMSPINTVKSEVFSDILRVNLIGASLSTKHMIGKKRMNPQGASIVWITSNTIHRTTAPGNFMYASSKAAMLGGIRALSVELAKKKVRINGVCPGAVETEMWEKARMSVEQKQHIFDQYPLGIGETSDIANACIYFMSDASKWITGSEIVIDGGFSA